MCADDDDDQKLSFPRAPEAPKALPASQAAAGQTTQTSGPPPIANEWETHTTNNASSAPSSSGRIHFQNPKRYDAENSPYGIPPKCYVPILLSTIQTSSSRIRRA